VDAAGEMIKIAAGTYSDVNSLDSGSQVVYLIKSLTLLGGFTTSDWENADPISNRVIIDPLHLGRGVTVAGSAGASQVRPTTGCSQRKALTPTRMA
jgi:hypothetical protein